MPPGRSPPLDEHRTNDLRGRIARIAARLPDARSDELRRADGITAREFSVSCPGLASPARGLLATKTAKKPRGLVAFFSGGDGTRYWGMRQESDAFLERLRDDGFTVVQIRWIDSWMVSDHGEQVGSARLACRPATVIQWLRDRMYSPMRIKPSRVGRCGFCITGSSGGATQVSYALSHYGLDTILDAVVPTGGPPHASLVKGCMGRDPAYSLPAGKIDGSYGFGRGRGPCARGDTSYEAAWLRDGIATGGNDYVHPKTRVVFVLGGRDPTTAVPQGEDYIARLRAAGSSRVSVHRPAEVPHGIAASSVGLELLGRILRA